MNHSRESSDYVDDAIRVALHHQQSLDTLARDNREQKEALLGAIDESETLITSLGYQLPTRAVATESVPALRPQLSLRPYQDILEEARQAVPATLDWNDLLTPQEIEVVLGRHAAIGSELSWLNSLDRFDYAIAIASGVIAGVLDVLLVGIPQHPGFLGSVGAKGGWLSNLMKEKFGQLLPPDKVRELEAAYKVCYDPSTSSRLDQSVAGLGPRTHRYQSLGHDPLLGFIFGTLDTLGGQFSAIDKKGQLIVQPIGDPFQQGEQLFVRLAEALKRQFGHLASDVATPAGLPAPLMPLVSFLQFGKVGKQSYTIAEVARQMYRSGYDFRHFMAGSIPVMVTEVIVRLGYFIRALRAGKSLAEAIPTASSLKLRRQLLIAHSVATLINAGKVYVTQNPLAISWAQALAFLRYVLPELTYLLYGKEAARSRLAEKEILSDYHRLNAEIDQLLII